jgi:hypothetical protein
MLVPSLVVLVWAAALQAVTPGLRGATYTVGADVDRTGHIAAVQVDKDVAPQLATVLARAVRQWRFAPPVMEGHPVTVHTWICADILATPKPDGNYTISVSFVSNGPKTDKNLQAWRPKYPVGRLRVHDGAFVMVKAVLQADGSITDPIAFSRVEGWPLHPDFAKSAEEAVQHWHAVPEQVDGTPVKGEVFFPMSFWMNPPRYTPGEIDALRADARKRGDPKADDREVPVPPVNLAITGNSVLTAVDTHKVTFGGD